MIKSGTSKKTFTNLTCFTILASSEIILEISLKKSDEAKIKWQNKFINVLFFIIKYFTIIKKKKSFYAKVEIIVPTLREMR